VTIPYSTPAQVQAKGVMESTDYMLPMQIECGGKIEAGNIIVLWPVLNVEIDGDMRCGQR